MFCSKYDSYHIGVLALPRDHGVDYLKKNHSQMCMCVCVSDCVSVSLQ